jgi:hypothetical protein
MLFRKWHRAIKSRQSATQAIKPQLLIQRKGAHEGDAAPGPTSETSTDDCTIPNLRHVDAHAPKHAATHLPLVVREVIALVIILLLVLNFIVSLHYPVISPAIVICIQITHAALP